MDSQKIIQLAQLHSIKDTWTDEKAVNAAKERLQKAFNANPLAKKSYDFKFVIDDQATYYQLDDFHSPQAKVLFGKYSQLQKSYKEQSEKLEEMRSKYACSNTDEKTKMSAAILDLEKRIQQLSEEVEQTAIQIRNLEKQTIK